MTRTLFTGGTVFDGTGSAPALADVAVEDGRIVEVGPGLDGDRAVDCAGAMLLPGMFDCHVHVTVSDLGLLQRVQKPFSYQFYEAARNLWTTLKLGITTVRDAAGADLGIKQALADGLIPGPRLEIAIGLISPTGGHGDGWMPSGHCVPLSLPHPGRPSALADGPDEMRRVARTLLRAGADVLKVCTTGGVLSPRDDPRHSQFTPEELAVLVAEATMRGRAVMAHAQGAEGVKNAVRAGIRSIEHGIYLDDEAIELMLARGTWLVPTLVAPVNVIRAAAAGAALPDAVVQKAKEVAEVHLDSVRRAVEAGVRIAMGTDSGVGPHGTNLEELDLMRTAGMSPAAVLAAATSSAAQLLGKDGELGRLAPGHCADLVVVSGDIYDFPALAGNVREVWQDGARAV
ncbi:amidohydrolase family protein [Amycolatopsis rubida]|uniref:Amidohydrolase family protein n=1 Tax=Amycolatopsis rubida TaxID=112413 RepID=A0A1I5QYC1_9PSEU|nr:MULTISPECIES: amidohydrolase family protein [Amycolatopsis]MYW95827.1 amidohydrolase family protein [Amycolatopsis rubida]NEC60817.1 amidohydrolase family protein [Amycolatopsis rubida]OAP26714.1 Imidazolonepropionase [Amycolatopsis sp. M39]SFP51252.1 Imidazolonepropionase [Amycolatopsis rubida]